MFKHTYRCIDGCTQGFVKLVCTGCRSCQFIRATNKKVVPEGRIPLPSSSNVCWQMDFMVFKEGQTFNGKKVTASLNIIDLYSNFLISHLVPDQTSKTVINCLKRTFAMFNTPLKIVSDNATAICRSPEVLHFLKTNGVRQVTTITSHNSKANKTERMHKLMRETIKLFQETFRREKPFDLYFNVIQQINNRPLSLTLHPNVKQICKEMGTEPGLVTPFSLHFGIPPQRHSLIPLENSLEPEDRGAFIAKWQHIIKQHDKMLQAELDERNAQFAGRIIEVGDLVLIKDETAHKEQLKYYKDIFEVIRIEKARYYCAPLFKNTHGIGRIFEVNGNRLKLYSYSELFDILPSKIRVLMGENLSPEQLKEQVERSPGTLPVDLHDWRQFRPPNVINLRNRITPSDKMSEPALSIAETDELSSSYSSSSRLSISESIPDHLSEVSSLLNNSNVSQIKTSPNGLIRAAFRPKHYKLLHHNTMSKSDKDMSLKPRHLDKIKQLINEMEHQKETLNHQSKRPETEVDVPILANTLPQSGVPKFDKPALKPNNIPVALPTVKSTVWPKNYITTRSSNLLKVPESNRILVTEPMAPPLVSTPMPITPVPDSKKSSADDTIVKQLVGNLSDGLDKILDKAIAELDTSAEKKPELTQISKAEPSIPVQPVSRPATPSKSPRPPKPPKSPSKLLNNITDFGRKLRSRSKIVKPFRFRDPNFTQ